MARGSYYLTDAQAEKLNNASPVNQLVHAGNAIKELQDDNALGSTLAAPLLQITYEISADASSGLTAFTADVAIEVIDVVVQCRADSGSGTVTVRNGTSAITDAIACEVDTTIGRAGTVDDVYSTLAVGDLLTVITAGSADRGIVTVLARKV